MKRKATTITIRYGMLEVPDCDPDLSYLEQDYEDVIQKNPQSIGRETRARLDTTTAETGLALAFKLKPISQSITVHTALCIRSNLPALIGYRPDSDPAIAFDLRTMRRTA